MQPKRIILSDFIFLIIVLLLAMLSAFSYQRINNLNLQADWVTHTNLIKLKLEQTISNIKDAQIGQRSFLLTRDSSYLQAYREAIKYNIKYLQQLDSLTKDNPGQQKNLAQLRLLISERLEDLRNGLLFFDSDHRSVSSLFTGGKILMNDVVNKVNAMVKMEDELLTGRKNKKNYAAHITPLYSLLLSVFAILIVTVMYIVLRNETRLRFHVQDTIKKLNDYFKDLPAVFAIVKGPEHIHELSNNFYQEVSGLQNIAGKPFREVFPELVANGSCDRLNKVYATGEQLIDREVMVKVKRVNGAFSNGYFNFIYQPIFNNKKQPEGILIFGYEITEMIEARKKVEETEQQSRLAVEAANIGTFDWDIEKNRFTSSHRLLEIFGFGGDKKNVTHQDLINRFHPLDKPIRNKAVKDSFTKGSLMYEARIVWPDNSVHWVNVYGKTRHNEQKETLRMYGTAIDITSQKMILEDLRESEATFRLLADSMPQFVWMGDVEGNLNYFSEAVYAYTGLTNAGIQQKGWISIVHPDDREENLRKWRNAVATGEEFIYEHRFRNSKGEYRWQLSRALPQKDTDGRIQRWIGTSTDIQDQKNRSQYLEQQISERTAELSELNKSLTIKNNIFSQAEENALIGSYSWNLQTGELEYSDNLFRLFGFEPNEFIPNFEKYHSLIHPDDKEQVMKDGMETMRTKILNANTYRIITKDGRVKHFRSTGKFFDEGENSMLIGTVQDISQDILMNEILRVKNLELERSNAELESFNYIASHDLQEPLRKIQAFSERILQKEGHSFSPFSQDYFARINAAAARMQSLINALLNYSKADAHLRESGPVDLNVLIENVKADLQDMIETKNARIDFSDLPSIHGIRIQVHQLFINLVSNAVKYSKANTEPYVQITASMVKGDEINDSAADLKSNYWKIMVTDNGIGFEQEYEHKIFELFQRLHSNNDFKGTGIGLAICKKIVRNHHGFITASGRPGIGSVFNIYFPLKA